MHLEKTKQANNHSNFVHNNDHILDQDLALLTHEEFPVFMNTDMQQ